MDARRAGVQLDAAAFPVADAVTDVMLPTAVKFAWYMVNARAPPGPTSKRPAAARSRDDGQDGGTLGNMA